MSAGHLDNRITGPFPGLRPFQEYEHPVFFGRGEHVVAMLTRLEERRFLAVVGASGSGKSSLVQAGLLPQLDRGHLLGSGGHWLKISMRPGELPFENLAASIHAAVVKRLAQKAMESADAAGGYIPSPETMEATLRAGQYGLVQVLQDAGVPNDLGVVLLVDQFEELFRFRREAGSLGADPAARTKSELGPAVAFVDLLLVSARQQVRPIYVVLTMRSDFIGDCEAFHGLPREITESQFLTPRLTREQIAHAITGPLEVFQASAEASLVNQIVNEAGANLDQLPLMQHLLMRMWTNTDRSGNGPVQLTLADYESAGGLHRALSIHLDEIYQGLESVKKRRVAKWMFRRLCDRPAANRLMRSPAKVQEIADIANIDPLWIISVTEAFTAADRHFLSISPPGPIGTQSTLDIVHEALVRQWETLIGWIDEEAASARMYRRYAETAWLWGEDRAQLLVPPELEMVLAWRERERPNENWASRYGGDFKRTMEFIDKSKETHKKQVEAVRIRRRVRNSFALLFLVFVVITVLSTTFWQAERNARQQTEQARQQAEQARIQAEQAGYLEVLARREAEVARHQAEQAHRAETEAKRLVAKEHLRAARVATSLRLVGASRNIRERQPETSALLAVEAVETTRLHGGRIQPLAYQNLHDALASLGGRRLSGRVSSVALGPNSERLASVAEEDGPSRVQLSNIDSSRGLSTPTAVGELPRGVACLTFSPDGRWLVAGSAGFSRVWALSDADGPNDVNELRGHKGRVWGAEFDPSGAWLITCGEDETPLLFIVDEFAGEPQAKPLAGHEKTVTSLAISSVGHRVATGGRDGTVRLWDLSSPQQPRGRVLHASEAASIDVRFSPDGRWLVTESRDKLSSVWTEVRVFDVTNPDSPEDGKLLPGRGYWGSLAFTPDSRTLAVGSWDGPIRFWNLPSSDWSQPVHSLAGGNSITNLHITADGSWLAASDPTNDVRLWKLTDGLPRDAAITLRGHTAAVEAIASTRDSRWLVTGSGDKTIRRWDLSESDPTSESAVLRGHDARVSNLHLSRDGHWLVSQDGRKTEARIWPISSPSPTDDSVFSWRFGADRLVLCGNDRWLIARHPGVAGAWQMWRLDEDARPIRSVGQIASRRLLPAPEGRWLLGADSRVLRSSVPGVIWDLSVANPLRMPSHLQELGQFVTSVAVDPGGRWAAFACDDNRIRVYDLTAADQDTPKSILAGHEDEIVVMRFFANPCSLVTGSSDGSLRIWQYGPDGFAEPSADYVGHEGAVTVIEIDPSGRWLASGSKDRTVRLWDLAAARTAVRQSSLTVRHNRSVDVIAMSRNGRWLFTGSKLTNGQTERAHLTDLQPIEGAFRQFDLPGPHDLRVEFTPDSRWLVIAGMYTAPMLWHMSLEDPTQTKVELAGQEGTSALRISADGGRLAAGDWDGYTSIWTMSGTAADIAASAVRLPKGRGPVLSLEFAQIGQRLFVGHEQAIRFFALDLETLIEEVRSRAGRSLTESEREQFMLP